MGLDLSEPSDQDLQMVRDRSPSRGEDVRDRPCTWGHGSCGRL